MISRKIIFVIFLIFSFLHLTVISVALEQELLDSNYTSPEGAKSVMPKIIKTGYKTLNLIHYFTAGADEVKCWTIRAGTKAPQAAGVIHTDFEKGFIKAEVKGWR